jgi:hypothetical protein
MQLQQGTSNDVGDHKVGVTSVSETRGVPLVHLVVFDPRTGEETPYRLALGSVFSVGGDRYAVIKIAPASGDTRGSVTITRSDERARSALAARAASLAQALLGAMEPDPVRDAERAAYETQKEQEDAARILEMHLSKKLAPLHVPPHPEVRLADLAALEEYLEGRGVAYERVPGGIALGFTESRVRYSVTVEWAQGHIRLTTPVPTVDIPPDQRERLAAAIERANAQIGQPLWRLEPALVAVVDAPPDDDGSVSSGVVEHAIALTREAVFRDPPIFRMVLRG